VAVTDVDDQITRIRRMLVEVPKLRERRQVFGEESHRFQVGPPLTEAEVVAFEQRHHIRLPEAYRRFLTEVANGGAGPGHRIYPLGYHAERLHGLDVAFPFESTPDRDDPSWRDTLWAFEYPPEAEDLTWGSVAPFLGTLPVSESGCSGAAVLVVTGGARGRVVRVDHDLNGPPTFYPDASFLDWYEGWLDRIIERCASDQELLREAMTHANSITRMLAWKDLKRRPELDSEILDAAADVAFGWRESMDLGDRVFAVDVLARHADLAARLARDWRAVMANPDPHVRATLVHAYAQLPDWGLEHPAVLEFLANESWLVRHRLLVALHRRVQFGEEGVDRATAALRQDLSDRGLSG
jgi:hypothetical protein